jgi:hypothetical protein
MVLAFATLLMLALPAATTPPVGNAKAVIATDSSKTKAGILKGRHVLREFIVASTFRATD